MLKSSLRLTLGVALILVSSAVLLLTDQSRPLTGARSAGSGPSASKVFKVALFQHISQPTIEEGAKGVIAGLAASGYEEGTSIELRRFNAEGDSATSNTIARALTGADYDLIITLTTSSLQAFAGANRETKVPHVFGMVSDPVVAGVGIDRDDPMKHPPYMVGLGTMQPVAEAIRLARKLDPKLARLGVAWNPSEANSEACTKIARTVCEELGIKLIDVPVDNSAGVREAAASIVGRGAEAIWIGGDTTVLTAIEGVVGPARAGGLPAFSNIPGSAARGTLFDLGADYYAVGVRIGQLAGMVLDGKAPETMPIEYEVPPELWINHVTLGELKGGWTIPPDIEAKADVVVEAEGPVRRRPRKEPPASKPKKVARPSRTWKIGLSSYSDSTVIDESIAGIREGLKESGLVEGRDFTIDYRNAQGDIATLNSLLDEFNGNDCDLILSLTTPSLQAGLRKVDRKPLLFSTVLDPFAAGAGKSNTDHRPNVTGAYLAIPYSAMVQAIREVAPQATRIGTLFTPGETNSMVARQRFEEVVKKEGLELLSLPVNGATDVADTALTVCQSGVDIFCQISDSLTNSSFPAIARACESTKTPLFSFSPGQIKTGAILAVGSDYSENGREAGLIVAEVIGGKDPSRIPFRAAKKIRRSVNLDTARRFGIKIPERWVRQADEVLPAPPAGTR